MDDGPNYEGALIAGKYRVERLIGTGGMGTVWEGRHTTLGTRVAIKFIRPNYAANQEARQRFEIEARAAAKLQSKHAVHVYDYGVTDDKLPYIVMEFLEGESLSELIMRRGPLPAQEVALIIQQASRALAKAHSTGVVHRDLKPDNIFLAKNTEDDGAGPTSAPQLQETPYVVKLVDFGIAKIFDASLSAEAEAPAPMGGPTREGTVIGTPNFMAPEQLTVGGAPGPLTDLWSLGACTFAAMTARIPFEGEVLGDIVLKVCASPIPVPSKINPNVPQGFDAWFARACARDADKRFQTATELSEALNGVCGVGRVRVATLDEDQVQYVLRPRSQPDLISAEDIPAPGSMSPRTALLAGLVLGITIMVGLLGFLAWRDSQAQNASGGASSTSASTSPSGARSSAPSSSSATSAATNVGDASTRAADGSTK
jgi:serine/threonine-protein kinase